MQVASQVVGAKLALWVGCHVDVVDVVVVGCGGGGDGGASIYRLVSYVYSLAAVLKQDKQAGYF